MTAPFDADAISAHLDTRDLGRSLHFFDTTASTSTVAMRLGQEGAPHGTVVVADAQTQGRGRIGRSWVSPPGKNLYLSLLLRPKIPATQAPELTLLAAVATHDALASFGADPKVKWPNDIELKGKKAVGILCEMSADEAGLKYVVVGVGIDVNMEASDLTDEIAEIATSLKMVMGRSFDRGEVCARLLSRFEHWLDVYLAEGFEPIREYWLGATSLIGVEVRARLAQGELVGTVEGMDVDGALLLRSQTGAIERVVVGDIERLVR